MRSKINDRPQLGRTVVDTGLVCGPLGVIEPLSRVREQISMPRLQAATRAWALRWRPEELIINLRPGLPCLLGHYAIQRGWKLTCVVAEQQLERAPSDLQWAMMEIWYHAGRRHVAVDVFERDHLIESIVPILGIDDVVFGRVPMMEHRVLELGRGDDRSTEPDDHEADPSAPS